MRSIVPIVLVCVAPAFGRVAQDPIADLAATSRESQMAAVEALVAREADPGGDLVELWRSTTRPDVHAMVARVLAGRGESAFDTILELADRGALEAGGYGLDLLGWAVAQRGEGALEAVLGATRAERANADLVALYTIDHLGLDRVALGFELAQSESRADRSFAHHRLLFDAPAQSVSALLVGLAESEDAQDRRLAAMHLPHWSPAEREVDPAGYEAAGRALASLLEDEDTFARSDAMRNVRYMDPIHPQTGPVLRAMVERGERVNSGVESPLELYMQIERDPEGQRRAFEFALHQMDTQPDRVALALQHADRDLLTPAVLRTLMAATEPEGPVDPWQLSRLLGRVPTVPGYEFMVEGTVWEGDPAPLGLAVLPEIAAWLRGEDQHRSSLAAELLEGFGPAAAGVLPDILMAIEGEGDEYRRALFVRAALSVAPDDPRVRAMVEAMVSGWGEAGQGGRATGWFVSALADHADQHAWVANLVRPFVQDPRIEVFGFVGSGLHQGVAGLIAEDPSAHIRAVDHAPELEAFVRDPEGRDRLEALNAISPERTVRLRAAAALAMLENPPDEAIDALARAVRDEPMGPWLRYEQGRDRSHTPAQRALRSVADAQRPFAFEAAEALATLLDRRPERIGPAIDILVGDINALAAVLSVPLPGASDLELRVLTVPEAVGPERMALALDALLDRAERLAGEPREPQTHLYALSYLPTDDPRRLEALLELSRFGPGPAVNAIATGVLGEIRPVTPEVLGELREVLGGPPTGRLQAAVLACARLGPLAGPLLDELLAVAEQGRPDRMPWLTPLALEQVAPDDPRVGAVLERWPELLEPDTDR
jgi:hypothetical protein